MVFIIKMVKEANIILTGFILVLLLAVSNGAYLFFQIEDPVRLISGNSIRETISGFYEASSVNHRIFILFQFILLFIIIISFFIIVRKFKSNARLSKQDFSKKANIKSETDLDTLYEILKRKKEIGIEDIGKVFKVSSIIALGWSKILEDGDLAIIDYPGFGKPILRLSEETGVKDSVPSEDFKNKKNVESKKIIVPKDISKKEARKNRKAEKKAKKKLRKIEKKSKKK